MFNCESGIRNDLPNRKAPYLCYVTDRHQLRDADFEKALNTALDSGLDMVQVRERDACDRDLSQWVSRLAWQRKGASPLLAVNTRFDIALACGADGVHLTSQSLPIEIVRGCVGERLLIGKSVHSLQEALEAQEQGAGYLFFGPVFDTPAKRAWGPPQGVVRLEEVCRNVHIPVFAIGGINPHTAPSAVAHGARGLAAIGWFQQASELSSAVRALRDNLPH